MMGYPRLIHVICDGNHQMPKVFGSKPFKIINEIFFGFEGALVFDLTVRTELPASQEVWVSRGGNIPRSWPNPDIEEIDNAWLYKD